MLDGWARRQIDPLVAPTAAAAARAGLSAKYYLFLDISRVATGGEDGLAVANWRMIDAPKK